MEMQEVGRMVLLFLMQLLICEIGFLVAFSRRKHFVWRMLFGLPCWVLLSMLSAILPGLLPGIFNGHIQPALIAVDRFMLRAMITEDAFDIFHL